MTIISWIYRTCVQRAGVSFALPEDIREKQLVQINSIISRAFNNSPFYKKLYEDCGHVATPTISKLDQLQELPVVKKSLFKEALSNGSIRTGCEVDELLVKASTTGSTGQPMTLYFNSRCIQKRKKLLAKVSKEVGLSYDNRVCKIWRDKALSYKEKLIKLFGGLLVIPIGSVNAPETSSIDEKKLNEISLRMKKFRPETIRGYVSALYTVLLEMKKSGIVLKDVKSIIASAEYLPDKIWNELEDYFQCHVYNLYGGTESPAIALNLAKGSRLLDIMEELYFVEVLDKNDNPVLPGEIGYLTITDFCSEEVPMIRYQNGDLAKVDEQFYRYSNVRRQLLSVEGRTNDVFVLPDGSVVFSHLWHIHLRDFEWIEMFMVEQLNTSSIRISLVASEFDFSNEINLVKTEISSKYPSVTFEWKRMERLPVGKGGKIRNVVSYVENDFNQVNKK